MENPTAILIDEHQNILSVANAILIECDRLESGEELDKPFFEKATDFITNYADKFHHAKEEEILFQELNKPGIKLHCNPTEQMLHEHDLGRNFVKGIRKGLQSNDKSIVIANARGYAELIQEHIFKEDNILFPMTEEALSESTRNSISKRFQEIEKTRKETKDKYIKIAKEFQIKNI